MTTETTAGTALVTGASTGIGAAFARQLAERGHDIVAVARRQERLDELAAELKERHGTTVEVIAVDLATPDGCAEVEARLADDARPIEILVNNAGFGTGGDFARLDVEREDEMIRLNVLAVMRLTHAALGGMLARGRGGIINVSSAASFQPMPGWATYSATKAFVSRFTESIAAECRDTGVTVTALCPGFTRTEFHDADVGTDIVPGFLWQTADEVARAALEAFDRKRVYAVPGWAYRALEMATGVMPKTVVRGVSRQIYKRR